MFILRCLRYFQQKNQPLIDSDTLSDEDLRQALGISPNEEVTRTVLEERYYRRMADLSPGSASLRVENRKLGSFDCRILNNYHVKLEASSKIHASQQPDAAIVCLHGFGAGADQFESVFDMALRDASLAKKRLLIVCPQAHVKEGSPAWFPLNPMKWMMLFSQGEAGIAKLIREEPPGMSDGRREILRCCEDVIKLCGFTDYSRIVIAGFSQGAMMANDIGLHLPTPPMAIVSFSAIPLVVDLWAEKARKFKGVKVFLSHGRQDQLLPFQASVWLEALHRTNGLQVTYHPHNSGHDLGGVADIAAFATFLIASISEHKQKGSTAATCPAQSSRSSTK